MRRCIAYGFALIVIGIGVNGGTAHATSDTTWSDEQIVTAYEGIDDRFIGDTQPCGGEDGAILLRGDMTSKNACIFGGSSGVRMARYADAAGKFAYAIAFPDEPYFSYVEGLCEGLARCVYAQAGDLLLLQTGLTPPYYTYAVVKDFTRYISRQGFVTPTYQFHRPNTLNYMKMGPSSVATGVAAVTSDGRWILIELVLYGLARMDAMTGQFTRVASRDSLPVSGGAVISLDISDDGQWAVVAGNYTGIYLYKIDDTCGDVLVGTSSTIFSVDTVRCGVIFLRATSWFFVSGDVLYAPRLSANGQRLTLYRRSGVPVKTILSSQPAHGAIPHYVAFGDSFTSGEGELKDRFYLPETNTSQNHCHVSTRSYPYLLQIPWTVVAKNLACSGSRVEGVRQASRTYTTVGEAEAPTLVSLSVGGNDADFMGKLKNCIGPGTCEWAKEKYRLPVAHEIRNLFPRLVELIAELKREYAPANVFVVGYPDIVNAQSRSHCSLLIGTLLDTQERKFMSESIKYLNKVLKAAAYSAKVSFADIETAYGDERLCDVKGTAMNGLRYGDDIAPIPFLGKLKFIGAESFHPTPRGHQLAAIAIVNGLGRFLNSPECNNCAFNESDLDTPSYWREGSVNEQTPIRLLAKLFLDKEIYTHLPDALFNFIKGTFEPNSSVTLELHSEELQLAEVVAEDDGSLSGSVELPLDEEGYHTVHAKGTSYSGEAIDLYQTIYIGEVPADTTYSWSIEGVETAAEETIANDRTTGALSSNETEGEVKGVQASAGVGVTRPVALHESMHPWYWWVAAGAIVGCVAFIVWLVAFFKKRKPRQ